MKIYVVVRSGVYRNDVRALCSTLDLAIAAVADAFYAEPDGYHHYIILRGKLDWIQADTPKILDQGRDSDLERVATIFSPYARRRPRRSIIKPRSARRITLSSYKGHQLQLYQSIKNAMETGAQWIYLRDGEGWHDCAPNEQRAHYISQRTGRALCGLHHTGDPDVLKESKPRCAHCERKLKTKMNP